MLTVMLTVIVILIVIVIVIVMVWNGVVGRESCHSDLKRLALAAKGSKDSAKKKK